MYLHKDNGSLFGMLVGSSSSMAEICNENNYCDFEGNDEYTKMANDCDDLGGKIDDQDFTVCGEDSCEGTCTTRKKLPTQLL